MFPDQSLTQESIRQAVCSDITFSFIYLAHPRSVTGEVYSKNDENEGSNQCKKEKKLEIKNYWPGAQSLIYSRAPNNHAYPLNFLAFFQETFCLLGTTHLVIKCTFSF